MLFSMEYRKHTEIIELFILRLSFIRYLIQTDFSMMKIMIIQKNLLVKENLEVI